jgi:hypothetical protein
MTVDNNCAPHGPVSKLEKIKQQIKALDPKDVWELSEWLNEYTNELWDQQMEADVKAGRLDKLAEQVRKDIAEGKVRPL